MYMTQEGGMEHRVQQVVFTKRGKGGEALKHRAKIITYADRKKHKTKLILLLINDMEMSIQDIIEIYRQRWEIELLFKGSKRIFPSDISMGRVPIHQNSDLGHMLMVLQKLIKRNWSFSNLATMMRIMLMYYIDCHSFCEHPEKDWLKILDTHDNPPDEPSLFDQGDYFSKKESATPIDGRCG
jgi:transposase DDE domain